MSINGTKGSWQVRWRDQEGVQRKRMFARKLDAQRFLCEQQTEAKRRRFRLEMAALAIEQQPMREALSAHDDALWAELLADAGGFDPAGCYVYLLWSQKGDPAPLYVGSSINILSRLGTHLGNGSKRPQVGWVSVVRCASEDEMLTREYALIRKFRPPWNAFVPLYARITPDDPAFQNFCAPAVP